MKYRMAFLALIAIGLRAYSQKLPDLLKDLDTGDVIHVSKDAHTVDTFDLDGIIQEVIHDDTAGLLLRDPSTWQKKHRMSLVFSAFTDSMYGSDTIKVITFSSLEKDKITWEAFEDLYDINVISYMASSSCRKAHYIIRYTIMYDLVGLIHDGKYTPATGSVSQNVVFCRTNDCIKGLCYPHVISNTDYLIGHTEVEQYLTEE